MQLESGIENTNPTFFLLFRWCYNNHSIHFQTIKSEKRDVYFVDTINKNMQKNYQEELFFNKRIGFKFN